MKAKQESTTQFWALIQNFRISYADSKIRSNLYSMPQESTAQYLTDIFQGHA